MLDRILAGVDDSKECARVLRLAIELAQEISADLKVIIVLKPLPAYSSRSRCLRSSPTSWRQAQPQKCNALQNQARHQMGRAGIYANVELVSGNEVQRSLNTRKNTELI